MVLKPETLFFLYVFVRLFGLDRVQTQSRTEELTNSYILYERKTCLHPCLHPEKKNDDDNEQGC